MLLQTAVYPAVPLPSNVRGKVEKVANRQFLQECSGRTKMERKYDDKEHEFRVMLHKEIADLKQEIADLKTRHKTLSELCTLYKQEMKRMEAKQKEMKLQLQAWRDSK